MSPEGVPEKNEGSRMQASEEIVHLEHVDGRQFRLYNILMLIVMALGSLTSGYASSVIATVNAQPSYLATFDLEVRSDANDLIGLTNSLYYAGGFCGAFLSCFIADIWGRRWGIAVPCLLISATAALLAGSVNIGMFITFRFFSGLTAFMLLAAIPVWMSEVAPPRLRGSLVAVHNLALLFGYVEATWIGYGIYIHSSSKDIWRLQFALNCVPALILLPCLYWMPESPRWLILHDRAAEAETLLHRLHPAEEARIEMIQIQRQIEIDRNLETSYLSILTKRSYRKRAIMTFCLMCAIQMTGPLVINNYGATVYALLGYDTEKQLAYLGGWVTVCTAGGSISLWTIQQVSRPRLITFGIVASVACLAVEAALVATYATTQESLDNPNSAALKAAVAMIYVFIFIFECTLGGTQYVYCSELWPNHIRTKGLAIGTAGLSAMNIIFLQVAPMAFENIGWKFYLCFICPSLVAAVLVFTFCPDTKGLPLEDIAALFGDEVGSDLVQAEELKLGDTGSQTHSVAAKIDDSRWGGTLTSTHVEEAA